MNDRKEKRSVKKLSMEKNIYHIYNSVIKTAHCQ